MRLYLTFFKMSVPHHGVQEATVELVVQGRLRPKIINAGLHQ